MMLIIFSVVLSGSWCREDIKYICFKIMFMFFGFIEVKNNGNQYSISNKCRCDPRINEPGEIVNI